MLLRSGISEVANNVYGSNMILVGKKCCIDNGDVNRDGAFDAIDLIAVDNDVANFVIGYEATDINDDGAVDALDMIICDNNSANFLSAIKHPRAPVMVKIPKIYEQMKATEKYMNNRTDQKQIKVK